MSHLKVVSLGTFVASKPPMVEPSQFLGKAIEEGALAPNSEPLYASELRNLFVSFEADSLGSGRKIACLLMEKSTTIKIKNVKQYLSKKTRRVASQGRCP
jgi:hypothetical protein